VPPERTLVSLGFQKEKRKFMLQRILQTNFNRQDIRNSARISEKTWKRFVDAGQRESSHSKTKRHKPCENRMAMFVDSDIILSRDWFGKAEKYLKSDVGAVWGVNIDVIPNVRSNLFWNVRMFSITCFSCVSGFFSIS